MEKTNMGETVIEGNNIEYCFDDENFILTFLVGNNLIKIDERLDYIIGRNYETLIGNGNLYKLSMPIGGNGTDNLDGGVIMATMSCPVDFYIKGYDEKVKFRKMVLEFPELQYFMDSTDLLHVEETKIVLDREKKVKCEFDILHNGMVVKAAFENYLDGGVGLNFAKCETMMRLVLTFSETNNLEFLTGLYFRMRGFLSLYVIEKYWFRFSKVIWRSEYKISRVFKKISREKEEKSK